MASSQKKYSTLVSNTLLFAISNFSSKLLSFFIRPYLSYALDTPDIMGVSSLLQQATNLLIPVVSLGVSLYQSSELGASPYDSLALILDDRFPKIPYFWCRIAVDGTSTLLAWLLGGVVGWGTLACALGLGPFVHFFNQHVSEPFCRVEKSAPAEAAGAES